ncbi:hypothetical protein E2C01_029090 [Portunus trituberculatus]|uniref:Uncharacterized protein n=1 Tax=Portunus trituberculatus TaxID=210409 RepID=A0A5B7EN93_PORTR|nr:hypothetical protein [Portunus trituberculatus]
MVNSRTPHPAQARFAHDQTPRPSAGVTKWPSTHNSPWYTLLTLMRNRGMQRAGDGLHGACTKRHTGFPHVPGARQCNNVIVFPWLYEYPYFGGASHSVLDALASYSGKHTPLRPAPPRHATPHPSPRRPHER